MVPAIAEFLERQAASLIDNDRIFSASANELGGYALDLRTLPRCSKQEFSHRKCRLSAPSFDLKMRWIEGVSLSTGKSVAIPHTLVYLNTNSYSQHEYLQSPISTGLAAHTDMRCALVSGLLEVIERDALSIMWLQKIPGQHIDAAFVDNHIGGWLNKRSARLDYLFMDIHTDLPVPVVCCVRRSADSDTAHTIITCAAGFHLPSAVAKCARDISARSIGFRQQRHLPQLWEDFIEIHHGATYMAAKERSCAFDFLTSPTSSRSGAPLSTSCDEAQETLDQLDYLIKQLQKRSFDAYAVDLTTIEAAAVNVKIVRVLVPGLQPLPYVYTARYLAHDRLFYAPRAMGFRVHQEEQINQWPLPFA